MDINPDELHNYFDASILDYKEGSSRFRERLPKMTQGYFDFTEACFQDGAIAKKEKQLMALSISIYAQDEYCIMYHTKGAVENGATEDEIMETVAISAALGGGAAFSQGVTLAMDTFDYYSEVKH
ncbi:carboxymuconolactone decarboxylase family protein [Aquibacillus koreensis]|uniref:Carboxymuconolactone decarboxylase family protein n=1 Tax=Aquibacillus koreensis TaxID=279446 RepID=A0A9X3WIY8_9BACI|nr:carboxymuconolactone decarboxylase family protein [Aquibacillus koreensis]MCT2536512.1 carboxymuconolactone decarboxylase family protein [Aquibacillus koreensis]MDC3419400.1 carboxymuconolactone decarboxylase family protein [Aquibacillus koreensis]